MGFRTVLAASVLLAPSLLVNAQSGPWGQCGGNNWSGSTTCVAGYYCKWYSEWYSQCIPGTASSVTTTSTRTTSSSSTRTSSSTTASATPSALGLHALAQKKGRHFGSAVDNGEINDATYVNTVLRTPGEFGVTTPGNAQKWDATEGTRGVFTYSNADAIINWAAQTNWLVRGHTLVWHSQLPNWVSSGGFNNATLVSIVQNHISNVAGHFKGKVYAWDVVNEMFNEDGTFRQSVFYNTIGERYIDIALRAARAADSTAKLYLNEYNIDGTGSKSTGMYNLVRRLKSEGAPIDGIGVQAHLISGSVPGTLATNWAQFASLGVDVAITELDIRITLPVNTAKLAQQKTDYKNVVAACLAVPRCIGVTIWAASDKHSWIPSVFPSEGAALPWDENFQKKPAYAGIVEALTA